ERLAGPLGVLLLVVQEPELWEGVGECGIEVSRALVVLERLPGEVVLVRGGARTLRLQPVEVAVVEVERRVLRGDRGHAIELRLGQLEPARPDVEERVLPYNRPHPESELLRGLDRVGGGGRGGVSRVD